MQETDVCLFACLGLTEIFGVFLCVPFSVVLVEIFARVSFVGVLLFSA